MTWTASWRTPNSNDGTGGTNPNPFPANFPGPYLQVDWVWLATSLNAGSVIGNNGSSLELTTGGGSAPALDTGQIPIGVSQGTTQQMNGTLIPPANWNPTPGNLPNATTNVRPFGFGNPYYITYTFTYYNASDFVHPVPKGSTSAQSLFSVLGILPIAPEITTIRRRIVSAILRNVKHDSDRLLEYIRFLGRLNTGSISWPFSLLDIQR